MKRQIITTADGSKTIHFPEWNESYHSKHGALQEAKHVYIQAGLDFVNHLNETKSISILEIGFGTGLNSILSLEYAVNHNQKIKYTSIEKYPLDSQVIEELSYDVFFEKQNKIFRRIHDIEWGKYEAINDNFSLQKINIDLKEFKAQSIYNLIFFDAFGPRVQPELWSKNILKQMYDALKPNGVWVTYCCKGSVRRDLIDIGFKVDKLQGPPGKREMLRAMKTL